MHVEVFSFLNVSSVIAVELLCVQSAGLTAGVTASCPAALLLAWTLPIMVAVLSTHRGSLGQSAATWLHWHDKNTNSHQVFMIRRNINVITQTRQEEFDRFGWYLTCVWCNAFMSTSIVAAFLIIGAVTVIRAELSTQPCTPAPARTHSWLGWGEREINIYIKLTVTQSLLDIVFGKDGPSMLDAHVSSEKN